MYASSLLRFSGRVIFSRLRQLTKAPDPIDSMLSGNLMVCKFLQRLKASSPIVLIVDGNDISGLSTSVIKDRKILADNGMVAVVICIDSRINKILCKPSIVSRGFVFIKESQTLMKEAENLVYDALKENMKQRVTFGDLKNCIRNTLEPFLFQKTNRNPIVIPVILNQKAAMEEIQQKTSK